MAAESSFVVVDASDDMELVDVEDVPAAVEVSEGCRILTGSSVKYAGELSVQAQLSLVPRQQNAPLPQARTPTAPTVVNVNSYHFTSAEDNLQSRQKSVQVFEFQSETVQPPMS